MMQRVFRNSWALGLIFCSYLALLWSASVPMTGDQKVYLTVALEMRDRGEYLIPYLFNEPNFLKPPFQYWATLLGWGVFGLGLFGALAPSVVALIGSGYLVRRISSSASWLPTVFFCSTLASMTYGTTAQMEVWIVFFYLLAWCLVLEGRIFLTFLVVGIMAWVKGPLYPVIWSFSWVFYMGLNKRLREILAGRTLMSVLCGVLAGLSWFVLAANQHYDEVMAVFFRRENLQKINTHQGSAAGLWTEFLVTLFPLLPWMVVSLFSLDFRNRLKKRISFFLGYGLIHALFFTFFPYKVGTYLYPLTPLAVWLMSPDQVMPPSWLRRGFAVVVGILALALMGLTLRLMMGQWITPTLAIFVFVAVAAWAIGNIRLNPGWIGISALMVVTAFRIGGIQLGERDLTDLKRLEKEEAGPLAYFMEKQDIWHEVGWVSTALKKRVSLLKQDMEIQAFLESGGRLILSDEQDHLTKGLNCKPWRRFKKRMKFPLRELILNGSDVESPEWYRTFKVCGSARLDTL